MINHADIENIIGCKTLVTDRMQQAIEVVRRRHRRSASQP